MTKKRRPHSIVFKEPSQTQVHFKDACDVNNIIRSVQTTGIDPYADRKDAQFGYASSKSYAEAMREVAEVRSTFAELPSDVRQGYENDPERWLADLETPEPAPEEIIAPEASQGEIEPVEEPAETTPDREN